MERIALSPHVGQLAVSSLSPGYLVSTFVWGEALTEGDTRGLGLAREYLADGMVTT